MVDSAWLNSRSKKIRESLSVTWVKIIDRLKAYGMGNGGIEGRDIQEKPTEGGFPGVIGQNFQEEGESRI